MALNDYNFATAVTALWTRMQTNFTWITSKLSSLKTDVDSKASVTDLTTHTGNTTVHISASERSTWNGKQDALSAEDLTRIASVDDKADTTDLTTHTGNTTVHITANERNTWNAKQNALSAEDLARIASVDNKADASDLLNYYTKTETNNLLTNKLRREIVPTLPAVADAEENVIYLVPNNSSEQNNAKDEYMLINGAFELIGTTHTDLSGYYTMTQIDTMLSDIATAGLNTITLLED